MHIHLSVIDAFITFGYVIVIGFFWRTLAGLWNMNPFGQAMAYLF